MAIRNVNKSSAYDSNLDLVIQYFQNPLVRSRSRNQLERIARELIEIRVRANETKRTAVKDVHLDLLRDLPNIDIFEFAEYLDEETNAIARNASDIVRLKNDSAKKESALIDIRYDFYEQANELVRWREKKGSS